MVIHRDRADVWALLIDLDSQRALLPNDARIDVLTDRTGEVGSRWNTVRGRGTRAVVVLNEIVELAPLRLLVVKGTWPKATSTVRTSTEPRGDGTLVSVRGDVEWRPGPGTLVDRISAAMTASLMSQRALETFKANAERHYASAGRKSPR